MKGKECCIVLTTTNSKEIAILIAQKLVESKLSACVQMDEVQSYFCYNKNFATENEFRLMVKAVSANYKAIEKLIKVYHNYQLPQIIKFDITDGSREYIDWIHGKESE